MQTRLRRYRVTIETDAEAFRDPEELLITLEAALDAERRHGETAAVWLEGDVGPSSTTFTSEPIPIDPEYIRQRHQEEDPYDFN